MRGFIKIISKLVYGIVAEVICLFGANGLSVSAFSHAPTVPLPVISDQKNGDTVHVRKSAQPDPEQYKIYSALGIKNHPGKVVKTTMAVK